MSAIAGVYQADGSPLDPELLERMRNIVDYRGPDGSGFWRNEKVGLVSPTVSSGPPKNRFMKNNPLPTGEAFGSQRIAVLIIGMRFMGGEPRRKKRYLLMPKILLKICERAAAL